MLQRSGARLFGPPPGHVYPLEHISMSATLTWRDGRTTGDILARQLAMLALASHPGTASVDALVRHGCATLTGCVDSEAARLEAERVVRGVPGITAILNCIEVRGG